MTDYGFSVLQTDAFRKSVRVIASCALQRRMGWIYGHPGRGKTYAVRYAANRLAEGGKAVTVLDIAGSNTYRAILTQILNDIFGTQPRDSTDIHVLRYEVLQAFGDQERFLIIDEAQNAGRTALRETRKTFDDKDTRVGVVFSSTPFAMPPEVASRCKFRVRAVGLTKKELETHLPKLHPVLAELDPDHIRNLDRDHFKGEIRQWVHFAELLIDGYTEKEALEMLLS